MKAKTLKKDKVNIITLGCSKNMVDSEVLSGQLMANAIDVVHESGKKTIISLSSIPVALLTRPRRKVFRPSWNRWP
jgi:hypothetical protein